MFCPKEGAQNTYSQKGNKVLSQREAQCTKTRKRKRVWIPNPSRKTLVSSLSLSEQGFPNHHQRDSTTTTAATSGKGDVGWYITDDHIHRKCLFTKLRPFVHTFLEQASDMFEMYLYAKDDRPHGLKMADMLDPQNSYFYGKVITRDVVLGRENTILILDHTEEEWMEHKQNLIKIDKYLFFSSSCQQFGLNIDSLFERRTDDNETLAKVLELLRRIHRIYFDEREDLTERDVRKVLSSIRSEVLSGCIIIFSRISRRALPYLKNMAEQMGAICLTEVDPTVTHVVATHGGTEKSLWAVQENKFLVAPEWIKAASRFLEKQPEEDYSVDTI